MHKFTLSNHFVNLLLRLNFNIEVVVSWIKEATMKDPKSLFTMLTVVRHEPAEVAFYFPVDAILEAVWTGKFVHSTPPVSSK